MYYRDHHKVTKLPQASHRGIANIAEAIPCRHTIVAEDGERELGRQRERRGRAPGKARTGPCGRWNNPRHASSGYNGDKQSGVEGGCPRCNDVNRPCDSGTIGDVQNGESG